MRGEIVKNGAKRPSITTLLAGIVRDVQTLTEQQLTLFKEELKQDMRRARNGSVALGIGIGVGLVGLLILGLSLARFLSWSTGLSLGGSYGIVGVAITSVSVGLIWYGVRRLEAAEPIVGESLDMLKENVHLITEGREKEHA